MHLFPVRDAHPADQQTAAITGKHGLRGVELKPCVQFVQFAMLEGRAVVVEIAAHPHCRVGVEIALFLTRHALRAANQDMLVAEGKQVRAFPHIARVVQAIDAITGDFALTRPLMKVR